MKIEDYSIQSNIDKLIDESDIAFEKESFYDSIDLLIKAWLLLGHKPYKYDDSFMIAVRILDIAIIVHDFDLMTEWADKICLCDPERLDDGEKELWVGKVAFEKGDKDTAYASFDIAFKKSFGRCFGRNDKKYEAFYISYKK